MGHLTRVFYRKNSHLQQSPTSNAGVSTKSGNLKVFNNLNPSEQLNLNIQFDPSVLGGAQ